MLGRLANFVNGGFGDVSRWYRAVIFPHSPAHGNAMLDYYGPDPRHPSQLYRRTEGAILFAYLQIRFWRGSLLPGQIAGNFWSAMRYYVVENASESQTRPSL